jgi:hypothetical protein
MAGNSPAKRVPSGYGHSFLRGLATTISMLVLAATVLPALAVTQPTYCLASGGGSQAAPIGDRFGVCDSHFWNLTEQEMETDLAYMDNAGIKWLRCNFPWREMQNSDLSWNWSKWDAVVQKCNSHGISILGILLATPYWAGADWLFPGRAPNNLDQWKDYVYAVTKRYNGMPDEQGMVHGAVMAWEIWNEENIFPFWVDPYPAPPPPNNTGYLWYMEMLKKASVAIKGEPGDPTHAGAANPNAKVVMGGVAAQQTFWYVPVDIYYITNCLNAGAADYIDVVAYHHYPELSGSRIIGEDECRQQAVQVHDLVAGYSDQLEIWATESGGFNVDTFGESTQADYVLRNNLNYAAAGPLTSNEYYVDKLFYWSMRYDVKNVGLLAGQSPADWAPRPSLAYYGCFEDVFGPATQFDRIAAMATCSNPDQLWANSFILPDGDLAFAAWRKDDVSDSLNLTINDPNYADPPTVVDPATRLGTPMAGSYYSRNGEGKLQILQYPIGRKPVIILFDKTYPPPTVASISPNKGNNNASVSVTVNGTGFRSGATVKLTRSGYADIPATNVSVVSENAITCQLNLSGKAVGSWNVVVTNTDGKSGQLSNGFTIEYPPPTVTSISPNRANRSVGTVSVTVTGTGFRSGATVKLTRSGYADIPATNVVVSSQTTITCKFNISGKATGYYNVVVTNTDGKSGTKNNAFQIK